MSVPCPSSAELALLLARRLDEERASAVRAHVLTCADCREVMFESAAFELAEEEAAGPGRSLAPVEADTRRASRRRFATPPRLAIAATLAVAMVGGWWAVRAWRDPVRALIAVSPAARPGPVRLSGFPYGPPRAVERGDGQVQPNLQFLVKAAQLEQAAAAHATAPRLHALGLAQLLLGRDEQAIETLRRARGMSDAVPLDDDLAAALVAGGLRKRAPRLVAEGLEILARQPAAGRSQESGFNEVLALEALGLSEQAAAGWETYLRGDDSSPWADEARRRLRALRPRAATDPADAEGTERRVFEVLLPAWGKAVLAGRDADGAASLAEAATVANDYQRRFADPLLTAVVAALQSPAASRQATAHAAVAYGRARAAYRTQELPECQLEAGAAAAGIRDSGNPLGWLAELTAASCSYLATELADAALRADRAAAMAAQQRPRSPLASAQIDWMSGLVAHATARPLVALERYGLALAAFERAGDRSREARVRTLLADLDEYLGRTDAAWEQATLALHGPLDAGRRYQALCALVRLAGDAGWLRVAEIAVDGAAKEAARTGIPDYAADVEMVRARVQGQVGDAAQAVASLRRAMALAVAIPQPQRAQHLLAYAQVELAEKLVRDDPAAAVALVSGAQLAGTGELAITAAAIRAESASRRGRHEEAEKDLRAAIDRSREERRELLDLRDRDQFFTRREAVHLQLVRLLLGNGRNLEALEALESWREESLRQESASKVEPRLPLSVELGSDPARAFYAVLGLPEKLLVWRSTPSGVTLFEHPMPRSELEALVERAAGELREGRGAAAAARLSQLIFGEGIPAGVTEIVIAPDPVTFAIPFAVLPGPDGAALVAKYELELTPGLWPWLARARRPSTASACTLVVEGAVDGGSVVPGLEPLQRLGDEARAVAAAYPCVERARTHTELRERLGRSPTIIHYAGHALAVGPQGAALLLGEGDETVPLEAPEIETWHLDGSTVVLSACSGAAGRSSPLAGRDGLARAFLSAGARAVVANLWPVADDAAFELAGELHKRLSAGEPAARALQHAQQALAARGRPAAAWGGWVVVGAG